MNKVFLVTAITQLYSNFAMSAPIDPTSFVRLSGFHIELGASDIVRTDDFCYMNSAYVVFMKGYDMISATLIWNQEKNRPLRCDEYYAYTQAMRDQYQKEFDAYKKEHPTKDPRPDPHRR